MIIGGYVLDFLVEFIMELLFEVPFEAAMESKKLKRGAKTAIFCTLCGAITLLFGAIAVVMWSDQDTTGAFFVSLITLGMLLMTVFGGIRGHRRNWKN